MSSHQPRKRFGQHFLHDTNIIQRIVKTIAPKTNEHLVEIGPGLGALTKQILLMGAKLDVVELDRDLIPKLQAEFQSLDNLTIHQADALEYDFTQLAKQNSLRIFGNLPYNISTPLLFHLLDQLSVISDMHFMLQKEVAERITAKPNTHEYGRLSVMVQYYCQPQILFSVSHQAFSPPPKVESAFIRLIPYTTPSHKTEDIKILQQIVREAFSQRRKMLHNTLKNFFSSSEITALNIDPNKRPEQVTVAEYVKLSNDFSQKIK